MNKKPRYLFKRRGGGTIGSKLILFEVGFLKLRKIKSRFKNRGKRGYYGVVENPTLRPF